MTSEAKVGLLLALIFIFIIAFLINGLPNLKHDENSIVIQKKDPPDLVDDPDVWFQPILLRVEQQIALKKEIVPVKVEPPQKAKPETINIEKTKLKKAVVNIYVVKEGDTLFSIAKKFYGSEQGKIRVNIDRIFKANRNILESPDKIIIGQKIIVPALSESIEKRHILSLGKKNVSTPKIYVVRENDNLWKIATKELGNPKRYPEITKINSSVLKDEDKIFVGMRLKMPIK